MTIQNHNEADDAVRAYSRSLNTQRFLLTARWLGPVTTLTGVIVSALHARLSGRLSRALAANGIQEIEADGPVCHDYHSDLIKACEQRGSTAADDIKTYQRLTSAWQAVADKALPADEELGLKGVWTNLAISKRWPPFHKLPKWEK